MLRTSAKKMAKRTQHGGSGWVEGTGSRGWRAGSRRESPARQWIPRALSAPMDAMSGTSSPTRHDVGSSFSRASVVALVVTLAVAAAGLFAWSRASEDPADRTLRISTGSEGGTYHALGRALEHRLEADGVFGDVQLMPSAGSAENARRIADGTADLALVQSDTPPADAARLVASLYREVLHVVVSPGSEVASVHGLAGRVVSLGAAGSGTRAVAERVFEQFHVEPAEDRALAMEQAEAALIDGEVEAVCVLTASPSPLIDRWCERGARLLGIGEVGVEGNLADALHAVDAVLEPVVLPRGIYGDAPPAPVQTIGVSALLVACESVEPGWIQDLTRALFDQRVRLAAADGVHTIFRALREDYDAGWSPVPYHEGAIAYYEREDPPFLVEYAEATSLVITLLAGGFSLLVGVRQWLARRRKNRIDAYYNEVRSVSSEPGGDGAQIRARLLEVRQRAFDDLIDEKVEADESFTIFQDYLRTELERHGPGLS